jgi:hypothetical protein
MMPLEKYTHVTHATQDVKRSADKASKGLFKPGVVREALHIEFGPMLFQLHLATVADKIKSYSVSCAISQESKQSMMAVRLVLICEGEPRLV